MARRDRGRLLDWKAALGIALGAGLLYFALRNADLAEVLHGIARADPWWFLASVTAATAAFAVRALRWRSLIAPVRADTSFRSRFAATTIGFSANNLLPGRVGELARAYSLARLEPMPVAASIGSLVVERMLDGVTVVVFLLAAMAAPAFPAGAVVGGRDFGGIATTVLLVLSVMVALSIVVVLRPGPALGAFDATLGRILPSRAGGTVRGILVSVVDGLGVMRRPALLSRAAMWSVAHWLTGALSFWLAFRAFDIGVPFSGAVFLQSVISLAVALPAAPGFFGLYEAGAMIGLVEVWGVPVNQAMSFALGFHMGGFVPVTLIGLYYAWRLGISLRQVEETREAVGEEAPAAPQIATDDAPGALEVPPPGTDETGPATDVPPAAIDEPRPATDEP